MKRMTMFCCILLTAALPLLAQPAARIIMMQGIVQVRHGLEESWRLAATSMPLEAGDTILTGENSGVLLQAADGTRIRLGANTILDIADLRRLSEKEMFLWLMSQKIDQLPQRQEATPLQFGQITSVHGENKSQPVPVAAERIRRWRTEVNGLLALLENDYQTNAVVKCHKILQRYPEVQDCGEIHFYLGQSHESLHQEGQAAEAYRGAEQRLQQGSCDGQTEAGRLQQIHAALQRLGGK